MDITVPVDDGDPIEFECDDTWVSRWICESILLGKTYPYLPFLGDVEVVWDVGANCGATSVHFARHYPAATIHAFEPGSTAWSHLAKNAARWPNIRAHNIGLHETDQDVKLFRGAEDIGMSSVYQRDVNSDDHELITLRAAGPWATEHGIDRIDLLKVDVEGCESFVLNSLRDLLPAVKAFYLEYDSRQARRDIARLLDPTHELYSGIMFLDQGECIYLHQDYTDLEAANATLRELFRGHPD